MNNFEQNLEKLEQLTNNIKRSDISLEEALKNFEEGIKLAKTL
ncbi:MAG: exodeoxyribonuclease VII small subunit, partial [Treponema sp.]|nr:exodeoxyribonuclease VII small subunit [Treponema sp.]